MNEGPKSPSAISTANSKGIFLWSHISDYDYKPAKLTNKYEDLTHLLIQDHMHFSRLRLFLAESQ